MRDLTTIRAQYETIASSPDHTTAIKAQLLTPLIVEILLHLAESMVSAPPKPPPTPTKPKVRPN